MYVTHFRGLKHGGPSLIGTRHRCVQAGAVGNVLGKQLVLECQACKYSLLFVILINIQGLMMDGLFDGLSID
jgi:hypothetical protein